MSGGDPCLPGDLQLNDGSAATKDQEDRGFMHGDKSPFIKMCKCRSIAAELMTTSGSHWPWKAICEVG
jgi:hypothetical protein